MTSTGYTTEGEKSLDIAVAIIERQNDDWECAGCNYPLTGKNQACPVCGSIIAQPVEPLTLVFNAKPKRRNIGDLVACGRRWINPPVTIWND